MFSQTQEVDSKAAHYYAEVYTYMYVRIMQVYMYMHAYDYTICA